MSNYLIAIALFAFVSLSGMTPKPLALSKDSGWPILSTFFPNPAHGTESNTAAVTPQQSSDPRLQSTFISAGDEDCTTSLMERTQDLRNWLRQAKTEYELLNHGAQRAKH